LSNFIKFCRACNCEGLSVVFELGDQVLSGVFISNNLDDITTGPLTLVQCNQCSLVQLQNAYPLDEMYNDGYGYRSGATEYMRRHLKDVIAFASKNTTLNKKDYVLDIGCNDGTLLSNYSKDNVSKIGIDPVAKKYLDLYQSDTKVVTDFFTKDNYFLVTSQKAKIVTSISMFYDLEDPVSFAKDVASVMSEDGVWVFEQSYLPSMLRQNSYDTVCHEHLEYYSLTAISFILKEAGMTIVDASQNEVNGGSVRVAAIINKSSLSSKVSPEATWLMEQEKNHDIHELETFKVFQQNVHKQKLDLVQLLQTLKEKGKTVIGYGASTKGNVILQYCGINSDLLPYIGDITPSKEGTYTPGTKIPIISMKTAKEMSPDYFLVFPWAFRNDILLREKETLLNGTKFIFPLPFVEIVS
jgi:2-polyprenyl-3-methyl-5-hydroxy-6-metoxy-1,4-benzoquinol methylase